MVIFRKEHSIVKKVVYDCAPREVEEIVEISVYDKRVCDCCGVTITDSNVVYLTENHETTIELELCKDCTEKTRRMLMANTNPVMQQIIDLCLSCCSICGRGTSGDHPECLEDTKKEEDND